MLNQILSSFGVQIPVFEKNEYTPVKKIVNICGVEVPFYGEILDSEISIYRQALTSKKDLVERLGFAMAESGCSMTYSLNQFILALRKQNIKISEFSIVDTNWKELGIEKLEELAKKLEISEFISTVEPDDSLQQIVNDYYGVWAVNGIQGNSGLEKANNVLKRIPVTQELNVKFVDIDSEAILKKVGLTWPEIELLEEVSDRDFISRVIILLRTGRGDFNPFQYLLSDTKADIRKIFDEEFSGIPSSPVEPTEPVHVNENVEIDSDGEGNEEENLETEKEDLPIKTRKSTVKPGK